MHSMKFRVPTVPPPDLGDALRRSAIAFGHDRAPSPTRRDFADPLLSLGREINESGPAYIPWDVDHAGRFITPTTTLMFRDRPYHLVAELVRGKLNEVRNQYADWQGGGLSAAGEVESLLARATRAFGQALLDLTTPAGDKAAADALALSFEAADALVAKYQDQVFRMRHQRQTRFETAIGCRLSAPPTQGLDDAYRLSFNSVCVPLTWRGIEPTESNYNWADADAAVDWALARNLRVFGGPLIDLSPAGLPDYVLRADPDPLTLKSLMCDYVETVVNRYRGKIMRWLVTAGANGTSVLGLSEEDLIRLTAMAADAVWQTDQTLQVVFGLSQPWGDYLATPGFEYSAFVFADTLLRAGLPFAGIEVEWLFGTSPRGSYCRDLLESSRQLDLFGLLGVPVQVSLAYPSSRLSDSKADPAERVENAGHWRDFSSAVQADWASKFTALATCKSYVSGVFWDHFSDADPHRIPNAGLVDGRGMIKPAFDRLRALREEHLK